MVMVLSAGLVRTLFDCLFGNAHERGDMALGDLPLNVPRDLLFEWFRTDCSFLTFVRDLRLPTSLLPW